MKRLFDNRIKNNNIRQIVNRMMYQSKMKEVWNELCTILEWSDEFECYVFPGNGNGIFNWRFLDNRSGLGGVRDQFIGVLKKTKSSNHRNYRK